jgi:hypothetical protein
LRRATPWWAKAEAVYWVIGLPMLAVVLGLRGLWGLWLVIPAGVIAFVCLVMVAWSRERRNEARRRAVAMVGTCPACMYDLSGSVAESDGCTVCPECGAAWRVGGRGDAGGV